MTVDLLLKNSRRLAYFLGIRELPQPSIHALSAKCLVTLNLPGNHFLHTGTSNNLLNLKAVSPIFHFML